MRNVFGKCLLALGLLVSLKPVWAEDIDLFLGLPVSEIDTPNVLFIIDNTGNWTPPFVGEMEALASVFDSLPSNAVNVGIMLFTETGSGDSNVDGGYVRAAIRPMTDVNRALYKNLIQSFHERDDRSNSGKAGLTMAEAYFYFAGQNAIAGNNKVKTDYFGNNSVPGASNAIYALPDVGVFKNALNSKPGPDYNSPIAPGFCGNNYIIWVSNGAAQDSNNDSVRARTLLENAGGNTTQISITPSGSAGNMADEWARFMFQSPENITTFTLDINPVKTGQGPGWSALLQSMADQSGGLRYVVEGGDTADDLKEQIEAAFTDIFSRILSVNSVFASVALPASANTQSTFLNQVYIGLFRPDADAAPRWYGNLKQYKLGFDSNNVLRLLDQSDVPAVDSRVTDTGETAGTGFITECASSFWTPKVADTYWAFLPLTEQRGTCGANAVSNYPDGPVVEKGGQAYVTRAQDPADRVVYTCNPALASCNTLTVFATGNMSISADLLNAENETEREELIKWARGYDVDDENDNGNVVEMRPSVHGDIIHSQPVALDYAANPEAPEVVVFYGGNDGLLRAINGNRSSTHSGASAGEEIWTFMPPEYYRHIKRNRDNDTKVRFPASTTPPILTGAPKPYGVDGAITAFNNGTDRYIYFGLRRGGRSIYAMDVSNPEAPSLLWRRGCPNVDNDDGCSGGWENIGQTWSPKNVTTIAGDFDPIIIAGAGYDACEDFDNNVDINHACAGTFKGNSIFVIDGISGELLKNFPTERPVAGGVTIVPISDNNRNISYAYAADTGGSVYRISGATANAPIGSTAPADWTITRIASLGCGPLATSTCTANRKFLFGPDVVRDSQDSGRLGIFLGSGDREKPLLGYGAAANVANYFYGMFDRPGDSAWLDNPDSSDESYCGHGQNLICMASLTAVTTEGPVDPSATSPIEEKGWRLALAPTEQVVSGALTVSSLVNFSTQIPSSPDDASCEANLGTATTYNIGFDSGKGVRNNITGGGLVPTPVAGKVILDNGQIVPFCIGCGGENSAVGGSQVTSSLDWLQHKSRVYWNIER